MHEIWLQKYIKEHYRQIGFTQLSGPFSYGADFRGVFANKRVKVEAEWEYADYINHKHTLKFADILVVATIDPVPDHLKEKLPSTIFNLNREQVLQWAHPRIIKKDQEDYYSYPWRKFSHSLLYLYSYCQKHSPKKIDFLGSHLVHSMYRAQRPAGFQFGAGGIEESFKGLPEDKVAWDYWLNIAHAVAVHFRLRPAILRPTWIDRVALYFSHTGRITDAELQRFQDVANFIEDFILSHER
jgi:hypothetical protein